MKTATIANISFKFSTFVLLYFYYRQRNRLNCVFIWLLAYDDPYTEPFKYPHNSPFGTETAFKWCSCYLFLLLNGIESTILWKKAMKLKIQPMYNDFLPGPGCV